MMQPARPHPSARLDKSVVLQSYLYLVVLFFVDVAQEVALVPSPALALLAVPLWRGAAVLEKDSAPAPFALASLDLPEVVEGWAAGRARLEGALGLRQTRVSLSFHSFHSSFILATGSPRKPRTVAVAASGAGTCSTGRYRSLCR